MVSQAARGAYAPGNEPYVFINYHTRVLVQGFTGGAGTFHSKASIDYGTKIVGGTNPRKAGTMHLGLPVFGTVAEGIPALDMIRVKAATASQSATRLIGPNCPGII